MPNDSKCVICKKETYNWTTNNMGDSILVSNDLTVTQQDFSHDPGPEENYSHMMFCSWVCLAKYCEYMLLLEI